MRLSKQHRSRLGHPLGHSPGGRWKIPARNVAAQGRSDLALEQLQRRAVLRRCQARAIGVQIKHLLPRLFPLPGGGILGRFISAIGTLLVIGTANQHGGESTWLGPTVVPGVACCALNYDISGSQAHLAFIQFQT